MADITTPYYIVKQFIPNAPVWVVKLNAEDTAYGYDTLEQAETDLPLVQNLYPNNACRVQRAEDTVFI